MTDFNRDTWQTPSWLFAALNDEFNFSLDAAASDEHHLCNLYFTENNCAIDADWSETLKHQSNKTVFCNPPYSRGQKEKFLAKAAKEMKKGVTTVLVVPALPSEGWFPWTTASEIRFITNGRINFIHPLTKKENKGVPAGTCIIIFDANNQDSDLVTTVTRNELRYTGEYLILNGNAA